MDTNERAMQFIKKIWDENNLDAVECFRTLIKNESLVLYREQPENSNYGLPFYHEEPIVHEYSLSPLPYEIDIAKLISLIEKNDTIGFAIYKDNQIVEGGNSLIHIHVLSGLITKLTGKQAILFPHVVHNDRCCSISNGDIVEYITEVDRRHHYGEVQNIEENKVWIKEYAGYSFDYDNCNLFQQDSHINKTVCIPLDACGIPSCDDYHVNDMRHASKIRALWEAPCIEDCDDLRSWFTSRGNETVVYYIECESKVDLHECPYLYTVKELAERESSRRTAETIRQITLPESYVKGKAFVVPNTDEAASAIGAKVTYTKRNWSVVEISISDLVAKFPSDMYNFQVDGLVDFAGNLVIESFISYSPATGEVSTNYRDLDKSIERTYPLTLDIGNKYIPQVGSVITYCDRSFSNPVIAKVTEISQNMVRVTKWEGLTYNEEQLYACGQDDWNSTSYTYVPISACKLIPSVPLSAEQLNAILRFEDENELIKAPWGQFYPSEKILFNINNVICGLENLRFTMPEMFFRWIHFISSDYLTDVDLEISKITKRYASCIDSIEHCGDGTSLNYQFNGYEIDFYELIDKMSIDIENIYFPETDDFYW